MSGTPDAGLDDRQLVDVREPQDDEAHAQGHDQRVDPEDADADAVEQPGEGRRRERDDDRDDGPLRRPTSVATMNAAMRGDRADREVDAAGQHRQRLAAGEDRQRDGGAER